MKIIKPDPIWGPPMEEMKKNRLTFNPSKFIRHKEKSLRCYHHCLIRNAELRDLTEKSEEKRRQFYDQLRKEIPELQERRFRRSMNVV